VSLKPDLTFRQATRVFTRWSWFIILCGLGLAAVGFGAAGLQDPAYVAQARLKLVDLQLVTNAQGDVSAEPVERRTLAEFQRDEVLLPEAAADAVGDGALDGVTPNALLDRIQMTPVSLTIAKLGLNASSEADARDGLTAYTTAFLARKRAEQEALIDAKLEPLQAQLENADKGRPRVVQQVTQLEAQRDLIDDNVALIGDVNVIQEKPLSRTLAAFGGLVAGLAGGALLVLFLSRLDRRIREGGELGAAGLHAVEVDPASDPISVERLRAEMELAGIGDGLAVLAVAPAAEDDGRNTVAQELARSYADSGARTVLVSDRDELVVTEGLVQMPLGRGGRAGSLSSARVAELLGTARKRGDVVIVDAPVVPGDPDSLLLIAGADAALVVARRAWTTWEGLDQALEAAGRASKRPVRLSFQSGPSPAARSSGEPRSRSRKPVKTSANA
jgi:Mrp family chromosome partitioning ATPase